MGIPEPPTMRDDARRYYAGIASSAELKTTACCDPSALPAYQKEILSRLPDEVIARSYGCGSPVPEAIEGAVILDLGCGTGRDLFLAAHLVGRRGKVIGVDMTPEQLAVARRARDRVVQDLGDKAPEIELVEGSIEQLGFLDDESVDCVISNCVLNLSPDKSVVFAEALRVLRQGGELHFADVFASRRVPEVLKHDADLVGECLAGAMYPEDFRRMLRAQGILDHRVLKTAPIEVTDDDLARKVGQIRFESRTVRAFKLPHLEDICEDYGQTARYRGGIPHHESAFVLDDHHLFEKGRFTSICGNTAAMLADTRLSRFFDVQGDTSVHYGAFDCSVSSTSSSDDDAGCC